METTYLERLNRACQRLNALGGTYVHFNGFCFGSKYKVLTIRYDEIIACNRDNPSDSMTMPLHWFNEGFLYQLWMSFENECREQLTDDAYNFVISNK